MLKWGKFGSFYACSAYDKKKPVKIASSAWEKDAKKAIKKIEEQAGISDDGEDHRGREHCSSSGDREEPERTGSRHQRSWLLGQIASW